MQGFLGFLLCYLLGFVILHFTFRSVIYFELISVKSVRPVSRFTFLNVNVQFFHHSLLKRLLPFSFAKNKLIIFTWVYFWVLCFVPLIYLSIHSLIPHCLALYMALQ